MIALRPDDAGGAVGMLRTVEVVFRHLETPDIVVLDFAPADGRALPGFAAGAHIDLELSAGLLRQYSLCALPSDQGCYRIGVLRDPASRGGSLAVHALRLGERLRISEPRNNFLLVPGNHDTLLVAGGIGVTPLLCMAEELHRAGARFNLHYCARSAAQAAFLPTLRTAPYVDHVALHFDDAATEQRLDIDSVLTKSAPGTHLYVCGPSGLMTWAIAAAERAAWPANRVHREYFKADAPAPMVGDQPFQVQLARSGHILNVPADRSIVAVLRDAGVHLPVSCESGVCGTCLTSVLAGEPDHRDYYLSAEEKAHGDQMLPCCSRSLSKSLLLDL
jgi:vanillate O-demethylase ferredoxin subunit